MLDGYPLHDILFAVGVVICFGLGFIAGNQR